MSRPIEKAGEEIDLSMKMMADSMERQTTDATLRVREEFEQLGVDLPPIIGRVIDTVSPAWETLSGVLSGPIEKQVQDLSAGIGKWWKWGKGMVDLFKFIWKNAGSWISKIGGALSSQGPATLQNFSGGLPSFGGGGPSGGFDPGGPPPVIPGGGTTGGSGGLGTTAVLESIAQQQLAETRNVAAILIQVLRAAEVMAWGGGSASSDPGADLAQANRSSGNVLALT
jgi:hypothetical protein